MWWKGNYKDRMERLVKGDFMMPLGYPGRIWSKTKENLLSGQVNLRFTNN